MTYREMEQTPPVARPVLTRWQRLLVRALSERDLSTRRWYRAHVGGRWAHGPTTINGRVVGGWMHFLDTPCGSKGIRRCEAGVMGRGCSCEVYPWPSISSLRRVEDVRTFDEFREWHDGVRVVDLSRTGKVRR